MLEAEYQFQSPQYSTVQSLTKSIRQIIISHQNWSFSRPYTSDTRETITFQNCPSSLILSILHKFGAYEN